MAVTPRVVRGLRGSTSALDLDTEGGRAFLQHRVAFFNKIAFCISGSFFVVAAFAGHEHVLRAYDEAVQGLEETMECARTGRIIRVKQVQSMVEMLMDHLHRDPGPLLMLTALKSHSDYTFTHIVNVTILALAQAQSVTRDSDVIREYGIAAMMHDLGKMKIPKEILEKRSKLTEAEFETIRRHPADTLHILRETVGSSDLALIVGFEHHRRYDLTGYPALKRAIPQHFATRICAIADAYDAMRSNRSYQREMPPEKAMEVLQGQAGKMFDPVLVRLFVRMMGAYPPGTRIRLDNGEEAMVLKANPDDPFRPIVRILDGEADDAGDPLRLVNLAERDPKSGVFLRSVQESLLDLPSDLIPINQDGEVAELRLVTPDEAARLTANESGPDIVTADASLVIVDWLMRHDYAPRGAPAWHALDRLRRGAA